VISRHLWFLRLTLQRVGVRVAGFAVLALLSVAFARILAPFLPDHLALEAGAEAVEQILGVLATSMLAVTTFSLSIAVSAFTAAAETATPRATELLQQDKTAQNVLATFLGAFLFGLLGLIALNAGLYDAPGRVVLFVVTLAVVALVIIALIRWIDHLTSFGRMGNTLDRVEAAATEALLTRLDNPYLGGHPLHDAPPAHGGTDVTADETGYVQHIDMQALDNCAAEIGAQLHLGVLPGTFVSLRQKLLTAQGEAPSDAQAVALRRAFTIGRARTFRDDPRFGLIVLGEIAARALSPAVNDPGTAIAVLGRVERILSSWYDRVDPDIAFAHVHVPPVAPDAALIDAFRPIARDGGRLIEVQLRLQKSLAGLVHAAPDAFASPAAAMSHYAVRQAEAAALADDDINELHKIAERLDAACRDAISKSV